MVMLRKRTSRKGGQSGEADCSSSPVTSSPCESHVDLAGETANIKGSMRSRLKEIKGNITGSIRGNIKKRLSTSSISLPKDIAGAEDEERQQPWPTLRKSISSITSSLRNHRPSMDSRSPQDIARQPIPNRSRDGPHLSQDADRRSHTIHGCRATPALGRSGSHMRRLSLGALSEPSSEYDSTPRLPSLYKMLAKAEGETSLKDSSVDAEDGLGPFYDPDTPLFDIDWHDVASHINVIEEMVAKQQAMAKDSAPVLGPLPIRVNQPELPASAAPDDPSLAKGKNGGSISDSGISGCSAPVADSSPAGLKTTEGPKTSPATQQSEVVPAAAADRSHKVSIKWASQVSPGATPTKPKKEHSAPAARAVFRTSKVPVGWLDSVLETSAPLRSLASSDLLLPPAGDAASRERAAVARARQAGKIAVITPTRRERLLPKQYYDDFGAAARDLFRRFRWQYSPLMVFAPSRRAIYVYPPGETGSGGGGGGGGCPPAPDARTFDIEAVADGGWEWEWGRARGRGDSGCEDAGIARDGDGADEDDCESVSSGATEVPSRLAAAAAAGVIGGGGGGSGGGGGRPTAYREGLEWIDPECEAYMRSEISLLQDDDDMELASRLG